jgi:hypothetical protein
VSATVAEALTTISSPEHHVARWATSWPWRGQALWPSEQGELRGEPDGNRALVLTAPVVSHEGQPWRVSIKGVGARFPMFHEGPRVRPARALSAEAWFGESPWGTQGEAPARAALLVSEEAGGTDLAGMPICPVAQIVRLPDDLVATAAPATFRRYRGGWWQEQRLVPSTVRLFQHSEAVLEDGVERALATLGVVDELALDAFVDRLIATGLAALTLPARTAVDGPDGVTAYAWSHVWLDKDAVLAPDGALCFADLEGLERVPVAGPAALAARAQRHLDEHVYEWLYAVDRLLDVVWRRRGHAPGPADKAADLALRVELALAADPFAAVERGGAQVVLWVTPPAFPDHPVRFDLLSPAVSA